AGAGYPFGLLWEGESSLDELRARAPGKRAVDWNAARIRATADHQFGRGAADALLLGTVSYVVSKNTGKVRNVMVDGDHVLSLRAEDGLFTLKAAGAGRLHRAYGGGSSVRPRPPRRSGSVRVGSSGCSRHRRRPPRRRWPGPSRGRRIPT